MSQLTFALISHGSTANTTALVIPTSILSANAVGVLVLHQRALTAQSPIFPTSVTGTGYTFVSSASSIYDDGGATRGRIDGWRTMASTDTGSVVTVDYGSSVISGLLWTWAQISGVSTAGSNGASALSQSAITGGVGGSAITMTLAQSFASTGNGAFFVVGHDSSSNSIHPGAPPNALRLSYITGTTGNLQLASFYTTLNLSASTATCTTSAQYAAFVAEVVLDNPAVTASAASTF